MSQHIEKTFVVIGAGVVGCAVAHQLTALGHTPLVLEQGPRIAEGVTSRNSGVIHAGIYYKPNSLKASSCIRGSQLLYEWATRKQVPYLKTGKWIVGSRQEEQTLGALLQNAKDSGVDALAWKRLDPAEFEGIDAEIGLFSPETGIIDPFELSRSFQQAAEEKGAEFVMNASVHSISSNSRAGYVLETSRGPIEADVVINAAGLYSDAIAKLAGIQKYTLYPCRGDYFRLNTKRKYKHLIYPAYKKGSAGLGVHLTIALDGSCRLGPDVQFVDSKDDFSNPQAIEKKKQAFFEAASRYLKDISIDQLEYDSCGIRPKLRSPDEKEEKDFIVSEDLPGFINLIGIESPGLTASMALAEQVAKFV